MTATIECDVCRMTPGVYAYPRAEWFEITDLFDATPVQVCSIDCLIRFGVNLTHERAVHEGAAKERAKNPRRRRWFR